MEEILVPEGGGEEICRQRFDVDPVWQPYEV